MLILCVACGGGDKSVATPSASPTSPPRPPTATVPTPAPITPVVITPGTYSANTTWDVSKAPVSLWMEVCQKMPQSVPDKDPCVVTVMQRAGASSSAVDFFKATGYFLRTFEEKGRIDYGRGSAPWFNMGRDSFQVFLNGTPPLQELYDLAPEDKGATAFKASPLYADLVKSEPMAFPWYEYGTLASSTMLPDGGQRIQMNIPMQICRACPSVAQLIIDVDFDNNGAFKAASLEAPQPAKQR